MELTNEQSNAIDYLTTNLGKGILALDGPAGSGKTTIMKELVTQLTTAGYTPVVTASTNKAAHVLRTKGLNDAITMHQACLVPVFKPPLDELGSYLTNEFSKPSNKLLHKYPEPMLKAAKELCVSNGIYSAFRHLGIEDAFEYLSHWTTKDTSTLEKPVLLIDEASMLGDAMLPLIQDCYSHIILVGDGNQLPPVEGAPVFHNLNNKAKLSTIHRQADASEPLILAQRVLAGDPLSDLIRGASKHPNVSLSSSGTPVICWRNARRLDLTKKLRRYLGVMEDMPVVGETIISRNNADRKLQALGLVNNTAWEVEARNKQWTKYALKNELGNLLTGIKVYMEETKCGNGSPFRFSYAVTCHTAQGSEWDEIMIDAKDAAAHLKAYPVDARKWLYTAITRARHKVHFLAL